MQRARSRVQINLPELDQVLEQARQAPLSDPDYQKLRDTLHLLVGLLQPTRSTEKTSAVLAEAAPPVPRRSEYAGEAVAAWSWTERSGGVHRSTEGRHRACEPAARHPLPRL